MYTFSTIFYMEMVITVKKDSKPNHTGYPHKPGLQKYHCYDVTNQPMEDLAVAKTITCNHAPGYKCDDGKANHERIAYIAGTKIKTRFQLRPLAAYRAPFLHFYHVAQLIYLMGKKFTLMASGAPFLQYVL
ncbi:hypothetical protein [uncultured Flavobacterium sp.]|uniref:hypothetical protein n=1 Tax=uncultured Flavobacterium sp. TaxID=165435 RepID=UPI002600C15D|nr:hypothetical protein [uncultured Flavobacterium sp.]